MGKISYENKIRIQILWEIVIAYQNIGINFPEKG